jgi:hypothetical protein
MMTETRISKTARVVLTCLMLGLLISIGLAFAPPPPGVAESAWHTLRDGFKIVSVSLLCLWLLASYVAEFIHRYRNQ